LFQTALLDVPEQRAKKASKNLLQTRDLAFISK